MRDRIEEFLQDGNKLKNYRDAIQLLEHLQIFDMLRERMCRASANPGHERGDALAIAQHYKLIGYQACLEDLQKMADPVENKIEPLPAPNFGVREAMRGQGYSEKEIDEALKIGEM